MQQVFLALLLACGLALATPHHSSLAQTGQPAQPKAQPAQQKSPDDEFWDEIKNTKDAELLRDFLVYYPDSRHAAAAQARLATLTGSKPPSTAPAPSPPPAAHAPASPPAAGTQTKTPPAASTPPAAVAISPPPRLTKSFPQPRQGADGVNNLRVDFCLNWATNCGKPAAEAFCQARGFKQALSFQGQKTGGPTWVVGDQKICLIPACTALADVTCEGEADRRSWTIVEEFPNPTINQVPIATCLERSGECGKPAADSFCRAIGFLRATHFSEAPGTGRIVHFGDGTNCTGEQCRALKDVICSRGTSG